MTPADFFSLIPILIIAAAPIVIMIVISIYRNYEVVYGFSLLAVISASSYSLFYIHPYTPHSVEPLFLTDNFSLTFLGIIFIAALFVLLLSHDYIRRMEGIREEYYIILFTSTLGGALLAVASHFVIFFLGIELLSVSLICTYRLSENQGYFR